MRYIVEVQTMNGDWERAPWNDEPLDGGESKPTTFDSREEAQVEIEEHVYDCQEAVARGAMDDAPSVEDFRVMPEEIRVKWADARAREHFFTANSLLDAILRYNRLRISSKAGWGEWEVDPGEWTRL